MSDHFSEAVPQKIASPPCSSLPEAPGFRFSSAMVVLSVSVGGRGGPCDEIDPVENSGDLLQARDAQCSMIIFPQPEIRP